MQQLCTSPAWNHVHAPPAALLYRYIHSPTLNHWALGPACRSMTEAQLEAGVPGLARSCAEPPLARNSMLLHAGCGVEGEVWAADKVDVLLGAQTTCRCNDLTPGVTGHPPVRQTEHHAAVTCHCMGSPCAHV